MRKPSRALGQVAFAVKVEGSRVQLECARCGKRRWVDFASGPASKRIGAAGVALLARNWTREAGGCIEFCKQCDK